MQSCPPQPRRWSDFGVLKVAMRAAAEALASEEPALRQPDLLSAAMSALRKSSGSALEWCQGSWSSTPRSAGL